MSLRWTMRADGSRARSRLGEKESHCPGVRGHTPCVRRFVILVCVAAVSGATFAVANAPGARRGPLCRAGKVKNHLVYVRRAGGAKHHATGCAPRPPVGTAPVGDALRKLRLASLSFAPRATLRALRSPAARRVLAVDGATDRALAARMMPVATAAKARAARITHEGSTAPIPLQQNGSFIEGSTIDGEITQWDHSEPDVGSAGDYTVETVGKRGGHLAKETKRFTGKVLMNRCPDASGIAHGTIDFTLRNTVVVGGIVLSDTSAFKGTIAAQFADNARITSVQLNGTWSYTTGGRSVSGTATATGFHQRDSGNSSHDIENFIQIKTAVTTGTDDGIATSGGYLGEWVTMIPEDQLRQLLDPLQTRVLNGACVEIVPDADTVHVIAGHSVAIVAHLTDSDGIATFAGPITSYNAAGRVTPTTAQANTNATFTYTAPATAHAGETDTVKLSHISRRGKSPDDIVKVIIDKDPFPARFDGTWTTVFTQASSIGWTETVHGTASYVRDPASPHLGEAQVYVVYKVQSASVDWKVEGSGNPSGECLNTYTGSGTDQATFDPPVTAQVTLEDVRKSPYATGAEPQPFAYSVAANGDGANAPLYDDTHTPTPPPGCEYVSQTGIAFDYLEAGWPGNYGLNSASDPPVQLTGDAAHLDGHYSGPDATNTLHVEEDWSFTGSG
jgi:hypothetical protein